MKKRSVSIAGHQTSISIEEPFWNALRMIAATRGQSLAGLIATIDGERRAETNLSSAIRLAVLAWYQEQLGVRTALPVSSE
jgi:predicted DNA-binding ribbon-helix-helix protein